MIRVSESKGIQKVKGVQPDQFALVYLSTSCMYMAKGERDTLSSHATPPFLFLPTFFFIEGLTGNGKNSLLWSGFFL